VDAIAFTTATGLTAASQAEMEAGTEAGMRAMSPLRVAQAIAAQTDMVYEARATNTVFAAADKDKFIEYTGSFTQTFGSAASLGNGWKVVLKNAYTDSVYLTPSGGATIDGVADFLMYPGEARLLQCDGTNFHSVVLQPFNATYTASGFFFKPPGYSYFSGLLWGGGSSGGKGSAGAGAYGGGGGGGACMPFTVPAAACSASVTVTIGAGGVAVSAADTVGNAGGNSTFGSLATGYGGAAQSTTNQAGAAGGDAGYSGESGGFGGGDQRSASSSSTAGQSSFYGGASGGGGNSDSSASVGGNSSFGGAGGGAATTSNANAGGTSLFGGNGGAGVIAGAGGVAGTAPGGAGGGTMTGTASGAGARGELRIWGLV
jgi:hypothetical protein